MRVSVVIPTHNAAHVISAQLEALCHQTFQGRFEVIIADNRSTDALRQAVLPFAKVLDLRIVSASMKVGVGHARNIGCRAARGQVLAMCDADDVVSPGWLEALVAATETYDVVGGYRDVTQLNRTRVQRWRSPPLLRPTPPLGFLPYPNSASVALRRNVFESLGGWDESFIFGGEDVDLGWRAQLAGYSLGFSKDAWVHYRLRDDLASTVRQIIQYNEALAFLLVRYRPQGAKGRPLSEVLQDVWWIVTRAPYLLNPRSWRCGRWMVRAAALYGRARGSIRWRVWAI